METSLDVTGAVIVFPDAMVRFGDGCGRKRRGNRYDIRRAHPSAGLSSNAIRVGPYKVSSRGWGPMAARDCACVRACGGSEKFPMTRPGRKYHELFHSGILNVVSRVVRSRIVATTPISHHLP